MNNKAMSNEHTTNIKSLRETSKGYLKKIMKENEKRNESR